MSCAMGVRQPGLRADDRRLPWRMAARDADRAGCACDNAAMNHPVAINPQDPSPNQDELGRLADLAVDIIARCQRHGASQAEVSINCSRGLSTTVRLGEVETIERQNDRGVGISVQFGQRRGSASTADLSSASIETSIAQACAIARYTEPDPYAGLADPERLAASWPDLDLWHPWKVEVDDVVEIARRCEAAGLALDPRIGNSDGASVQLGESLGVYANSHGFVGPERATQQSLSCVLVARDDDDGMQRDCWYDAARSAGDLADAEVIGRRAGERVLARLGARSLTTRTCPVLFVPETARGLIGHFLSAVSGGAQYRKASFLLDHLGKRVFPTGFHLVERPHLRRGFGSSGFDAEGVATVDNDLVRDGELQHYLLDSYAARKLGLVSTANAGGIHNLMVEGDMVAHRDLLARMDTGLVVTELMGQGVNGVTGDYSRGAAGFWVERGEIVHPVEEITIAGNLRDIYAGIVGIGNDVDRRAGILTGSLLVERMTLAGS